MPLTFPSPLKRDQELSGPHKNLERLRICLLPSLFQTPFFHFLSFPNLAICLIVHLHRFNAFYMLSPPSSFQAINFIFFARLQSAGGGWADRLLTFSRLDLLHPLPLHPSILPLVSHYSISTSPFCPVSGEKDTCSSSWHLRSSSLLVIHAWCAAPSRRPSINDQTFAALTLFQRIDS